MFKSSPTIYYFSRLIKIGVNLRVPNKGALRTSVYSTYGYLGVNFRPSARKI